MRVSPDALASMPVLTCTVLDRDSSFDNLRVASRCSLSCLTLAG